MTPFNVGSRLMAAPGAPGATSRRDPSRASKIVFGQKSEGGEVVVTVPQVLAAVQVEGLSRTRSRRMTALGCGSAHGTLSATCGPTATEVPVVGTGTAE